MQKVKLYWMKNGDGIITHEHEVSVESQIGFISFDNIIRKWRIRLSPMWVARGELCGYSNFTTVSFSDKKSISLWLKLRTSNLSLNFEESLYVGKSKSRV